MTKKCIDVKEFFPSLKMIITKEEYPDLHYFLLTIKGHSLMFYDCNFKHNICIKERLYGCCSTCLRDLGFYKYDSFILDNPETIMSNFCSERNTLKFGFLKTQRGNEGCCLPRSLISNPCIIHKCFKYEEGEPKDILKYDELVSNINKYFLNDFNLDKKEDEILKDLKNENNELLKFFNLIKEKE